MVHGEIPGSGPNLTPPGFSSRTPPALILLPFRGDDTFHLRITDARYQGFSHTRNPPPLTSPLPPGGI